MLHEVLIEWLAVEALHHVVVAAVGELAELEDVDDVAVADLVDRARLGGEPLDHRRVGGVLAREHLDRDLLADHRMRRAIHGAEAALAEQRLDHVLADLGSDRKLRIPVRSRAAAGLGRDRAHPIQSTRNGRSAWRTRPVGPITGRISITDASRTDSALG